MSTCNPFVVGQCSDHGVCWTGSFRSYCVCDRWWKGDQCQTLSNYFWIWLAVIIAALIVFAVAGFFFLRRYRRRRAAAAANPQTVCYTSAYVYPTNNGATYPQAQQPVIGHYGPTTTGTPVYKY